MIFLNLFPWPWKIFFGDLISRILLFNRENFSLKSMSKIKSHLPGNTREKKHANPEASKQSQKKQYSQNAEIKKDDQKQHYTNNAENNKQD